MIQSTRVRVGISVVTWWTAFGIISALQYRQMASTDQRTVEWMRALVPSMTSAWLWIPATVLAIVVTRRFPIGALALRQSLPPHIAATLAVVLYRALMVIVLNDAIHWYKTLPSLDVMLITSVFNNVFFYWLITAAAHALHFAENSRLRETQLKDAQLSAIAARLQPHFLFNALNTIAALISENPRGAERAVVQLSGLLRRSIDVSGQVMVPLAEELRLVSDYLDLEQARFEERLAVDWSIADEARDALVPHFVLQPLVENSIRHGFQPIPGSMTIHIAANRSNGSLNLAIADNGAGFDESTAREGLGISTTRARLDAVFNGNYSFIVSSARGNGTKVILDLPYREAPRDE